MKRAEQQGEARRKNQALMDEQKGDCLGREMNVCD